MITREQRLAIKKLYDRTENKILTYRQFRKTVQYGFDCLMVQWCGMWVGIERDGYTHT